MNPKWIKDLNLKHKSIKSLEETWEKSLCSLGLGVDVLDMIPKEWFIKED